MSIKKILTVDIACWSEKHSVFLHPCRFKALSTVAMSHSWVQLVGFHFCQQNRVQDLYRESASLLYWSEVAHAYQWVCWGFPTWNGTVAKCWSYNSEQDSAVVWGSSNCMKYPGIPWKCMEEVKHSGWICYHGGCSHNPYMYLNKLQHLVFQTTGTKISALAICIFL